MTVQEPNPYVPVWARADNPTVGMNDTELRAHYKATEVQASLMFYLSLESLPADLQGVYRALLDDLDGRKAKPEDKALIWSVKLALALWRQGRPYEVPVFVPTVAKRKPTKLSAEAAALDVIADALKGLEWSQAGNWVRPEPINVILRALASTGRKVEGQKTIAA